MEPLLEGCTIGDIYNLLHNLSDVVRYFVQYIAKASDAVLKITVLIIFP